MIPEKICENLRDLRAKMFFRRCWCFHQQQFQLRLFYLKNIRRYFTPYIMPVMQIDT